MLIHSTGRHSLQCGRRFDHYESPLVIREEFRKFRDCVFAKCKQLCSRHTMWNSAILNLRAKKGKASGEICASLSYPPYLVWLEHRVISANMTFSILFFPFQFHFSLCCGTLPPSLSHSLPPSHSPSILSVRSYQRDCIPLLPSLSLSRRKREHQMNAQKKMTHFIVKCKIRNGNSFLFLSRVLSKPVSAGDAVEEKSNINFRVSINANEGYLSLINCANKKK